MTIILIKNRTNKSTKIAKEQDRANSLERLNDFNEDHITNESRRNSPTHDDIDLTQTIVETHQDIGLETRLEFTS